MTDVDAYNASGRTTNLINDNNTMSFARSKVETSSEVSNWIRLRNNKPPNQINK
ncbi:MAG: hypothetical protein WAM14_18130 [Candidatus Nitrosopolaris sp.]